VTNDIANYFLTNSINRRMNQIDDYICHHCFLFQFKEEEVINQYIKYYQKE